MRHNGGLVPVRRFLLLLPFFFSTYVVADAHTWSGAVDGGWSNAANWSVGGAPALMETQPIDLTFPAAATTFATNTDLAIYLPLTNPLIAETASWPAALSM